MSSLCLPVLLIETLLGQNKEKIQTSYGHLGERSGETKIHTGVEGVVHLSFHFLSFFSRFFFLECSYLVVLLFPRSITHPVLE